MRLVFILPNMRKLILFTLTFFSCALCHGQIDFIESSDLPLFVITTEDSNDIPDEPKVAAHLSIIYNGLGNRNHIQDIANEYDGRIAIEKRGNGSLARAKNSYSFETQMSDGENNNVSLLGFPSENDWILYAPETDKSLMRNVLVYELARKMGHYAPRVQFCEVIVNEAYLGIFVFMEKIKRDKNRVDITPFEDEQQRPEDGGFIVRIDSWWSPSMGWEATPYDYNGSERHILYQHVYPKPDEITDEQASYIKKKFDDFEAAMFQVNEKNQELAYKDFIDVNSLADYILINEFTRNPDAYRLSTFMHKDADEEDPLIKFGPVWDYNFGFGNYCCGEHEHSEDWTYDNTWWKFPSQIPFWFAKIMNDPNFVSIMHQRWQHWRTELISCEKYIDQIDQWAEVVDEAKERNFAKWPILGTNVIWDWNAGPSYTDETDFLKEWICERILWMDEKLEDLDQALLGGSDFTFPNPSGSIFTYNFNAASSGVKAIEIYNAAGNRVYRKKVSVSEGFNQIEFEDLDQSPGIYFLKLEGQAFQKLLIH